MNRFSWIVFPAAAGAAVITAIAAPSPANQIVCFPCTTSAPRKCCSSPLACSKRKKVDEEHRCVKDEWTDKFLVILSRQADQNQHGVN